MSTVAKGRLKSIEKEDEFVTDTTGTTNQRRGGIEDQGTSKRR